MKFNKLNYWLPVLLWIGIIFVFSSFEGNVISSVSWLEFFIKKFIHVIEYAILWFLTYRAFNYLNKFSFSKSAFYALIIIIIYAASDEFHQTFIPSRHGTFRDVLIDTTGGIISFYLIYRSKYLTIKKTKTPTLKK